MSSTALNDATREELQIRVHGDPKLPTLIYLPGLHGDWTLVASFRKQIESKVCFVEFTYPRTLEWTMVDYADAVEAALLHEGIDSGWLLGESFGSQPAWPIVERSNAGGRFQVQGVILAGGFVKHPWNWGPGLLRRLVGDITMRSFQGGIKVYVWYSRFRHRHAPETLAGVREFAARRTELDRGAILRRLTLLQQYDPCPVARQTRIPVYYLAGLVDPLVPYPLVRRWLRLNCPGYRGGRTLWKADHNVLATQPAAAASQVWEWMQMAGA